MGSDTLVYGRGTHGSHTVLIHDRRLRNRAGVMPRNYSFDAPLASDVEARESVAPVQSVGESQLSLRIENYLGSALAGYTGLASDSPKQIRMTASPEARAASMDPWTIKNGRRIRLIEKKHKEGLSAKEVTELERLKREVYDHIQTVAPRSTEVLDEIESRIDKLKKKAEAKRGNKV